MISIALRHLIRYWRLHLSVLICLTLASTILLGLSGYEAAISTRELRTALTEASPAGRNLLITGSPYTFDATFYKDLRSSLGSAFKERIEVRYATLQADPQPPGHILFNRIDVYSFDSLGGHIRIIKGRLPEQMDLSKAVGPAPPQVEAVIGKRTAEQAGYRVGDLITASSMYHRFKIVGVVEPLDANDDVWGGDLNAFQLGGGTTTDERILPLIIAPDSMRSYIVQPVFPHQIYWRITLDREHLLSDQINRLRANLINFKAQAGTRGAVVASNLVPILDDYQANLSPVLRVLSLLSLQSVIILLFALAALASMSNQSLQIELSTFFERGASPGQIFYPVALKAIILSMLASLILAPGLTQVLFRVWSSDFTAKGLYPLPSNTGLLLAILAGAGWLALTLPVLSASRRETGKSQPVHQPWLLRYSLDMYLFAFGSLLFWQLRQSGSFISRQLANNTRLFDPLLILGPSLMLAACIIFSIRLLPTMARSISNVFGRMRGSILHFEFLRLTHDSRHSGWVLLLAGLVSAQVTLNLVFSSMLTSSPVMMQVSSLGLELNQALWLNTLTLILFTLSLFFLLSLFMLHERIEEFQTLRTLGFSPYQGRLALNIECLPSLLLGVLLGTGLGLGLSLILFTYFFSPFGNVVIEQPVIGWWALAQLAVVLLITFGTALLLPLAWIPSRSWWASPTRAE
jgi:hypothetical protein